MNKIWNVAIYARVSTDKESQSESIFVQVENLKKWLIDKSNKDNGTIYNLIDVYEDHGLSGSNFDRESFRRMEKDIEDKKINMVLTRDLSRFSRNYVKAGYYLEDYFKVNNIRFISVLDNVDTENDFDDIIPFKNILNEMYIKDCSRKVRSALATRMERGSSIASKPPYGYKFKEVYEGNQKTVLLVPRNDETTEIVKEIFNLYLSGWGAGKIATSLNKRRIPTPSSYIKNFAKCKFGKWNNNTIISILRNYKYGGFMVQGTYKKVSYKVKKINQVPKEEWIWGGEFEGIIPKEIFLRVQEVMETRRETNYRYKNGVIHPFTTVLKCGKCNGAMIYRGKYKGYKCANSQRGGGICTPHSVKESDLIEIVTNEIKKFIDKSIDKQEVIDRCNKLDLKIDLKKELKKVEKELEKLDSKFAKLYEDKLEEVITEHNFNFMIQRIQKEQKKYSTKKEELTNRINREENDNTILNKYKEEIKRFIELKDIDRNLVEMLIDKIVVEETKKRNYKNIRIYFKFHNEF